MAEQAEKASLQTSMLQPLPEPLGVPLQPLPLAGAPPVVVPPIAGSMGIGERIALPLSRTFTPRVQTAAEFEAAQMKGGGVGVDRGGMEREMLMRSLATVPPVQTVQTVQTVFPAPQRREEGLTAVCLK